MKWARFFAPGLEPSASETTLSAEESHHLVRVMRLGVGDEVAIFDGRGHERLARVERAAPKGVTLTVIRPLPAPPAPVVPILLVQAVLKGDKMDAVVRDATMAGASEIVPIVTERSLVGVPALTRGRAVERWRRVAVSSAKQCGRAHLPAIAIPSSFDAWLSTPFEGNRLLFVEPSLEASSGSHSSASQLSRVVTSLQERARQSSASPRGSIACIVGPEGGWADGERERAVATGCLATTLGSMTLRADVAGLIAVSLVSVLLENP